uniref:Uncharacterized protein n=1 Tax=Panagrolaimus davidi TaxID=227884 RepID=A0A914QCJ3_9BILA
MNEIEGKEERAIKEYEKLMTEALQEYSNGCSEEYLKEIDGTVFSKIVADICNNDKNDDICKEILAKLDEKRIKIYGKFEFKNKLLLAKEAERIRQQQQQITNVNNEKQESHEQRLKLPERCKKVKRHGIPAERDIKKEQKYEVLKKSQEINTSQAADKNGTNVLDTVATGLTIAAGIYKIFFAETNQKSSKHEFERFKNDVEKIIDRRLTGWKTDKTFIFTPHGYYCCIFYDQGVTGTDVTLFYRKSGDEIFRYEEKYFYANKAHKLEVMLKERLQDSRDIDETWRQTLKECQ